VEAPRPSTPARSAPAAPDPGWESLAWAVALLAGVAPLWAGRFLPLVDLPQHLHLISVLHRLDDPTTLYPALLEARGELTPYLGYYHAVSLLHWLLPLDAANKVFLSAYVVGLPLSLAFLLRSLGRPTWPALLAVPLAYGDSLAWGFINYCSALPLTFLTLGLFIRALADPPRRRRWALLLSVSLCAVLLFHVQAFVFLGLALPVLLLTTRAPADLMARREGDSWLDAALRPRLAALLGVVPGVTLFVLWFGGRLGQPAEVAPGEPWKAWGPMFSPQNLAWKTREQNLAELPSVLANMLPGREDRWALYGVAAVFLAALAAWAVARLTHRAPPSPEGPAERWRLVALAALALGLYFLLPFDIRGYIYYLNTRYAHLAAPLLVAAVPILPAGWRRFFAAGAAGCALVLAFPLARAFRDFNQEMAQVARVAEHARDAPRVMGLIHDARSRAVNHPVFLHAAAEVARARGGVTNFSFALTPHSPLRYRGSPPPTFPSEWRPHEMSFERHGRAYDHFLVRGRHPAQIFGQRLGDELILAAQEGNVFLIVRRAD
jgi:hypothetical protein